MPARHTNLMKVAGASLLLCCAVATVGVADAATSHHKRHHARRSSTSTSHSSSSPSSSSRVGAPSDETELNGETATKAKGAALAAVPGGTVLRASTESAADPSKAAYEVHVRKSDGSVVEVLLDSSYKVLAVNSAPPHAGSCPGGPPPAGARAGAPSGSSLQGPPPPGAPA